MPTIPITRPIARNFKRETSLVALATPTSARS